MIFQCFSLSRLCLIRTSYCVPDFNITKTILNFQVCHYYQHQLYFASIPFHHFIALFVAYRWRQKRGDFAIYMFTRQKVIYLLSADRTGRKSTVLKRRGKKKKRTKVGTSFAFLYSNLFCLVSTNLAVFRHCLFNLEASE